MFEFTSEEIEAIRLSLRVASVGTLASLPIALFAAYALARWRFPGKTLFDGLVHLPLVLPPVVTGYLLLVLFGRRGPIGAWLEATFGIVFSFRWTGAALAAGIMGFPLLVRAIRLSFEATDRRLEAAASTLGARGSVVFATVTLPLALPGILAGLVLSFAKALGEFGATITFAGNLQGRTQTVPLAVFQQLQTDRDGAVALSLVLVVVSIAVLVALRERIMGAR
jgi:molybdate transport system permease protein